MVDDEKLIEMLSDIMETQNVHNGVLRSLTDAVRRLYDGSGNGQKWSEMVARLDAELATAKASISPNVVRIDGATDDRAMSALQRIRDMLAGSRSS